MRLQLRPALHNAFSPTLGVSLREPVLAVCLRDQTWLQKGRSARAGALAFAFGFGLIAALAVVFPLSAYDLPLALVLVITGVRVVLDTVTLARSWGRIGDEFRTGRWDLLRLTAQSEGALLRAHYAAAYASVWRLLLVALGAQTAATLVVVLSNATQIARSAQGPPFAWLAALAGIALFAVELMARPRALAALGLALGQRPTGRIGGGAGQHGVTALLGRASGCLVHRIRAGVHNCGLRSVVGRFGPMDVAGVRRLSDAVGPGLVRSAGGALPAGAGGGRA